MDRFHNCLRILHILDSLDIGGGERHVVDLAVAQKASGHAVTVACSTGGALIGELREADIKVHTLCPRLVKRKASLRYAARLWRVIRSREFDVIHSHMYASNVAAMIAGLGTGIPLVITEHSEAQWRSQPARVISRAVFRSAAHIIANSESNRKRLRKVDGVGDRKLTVIPGTVMEPRQSQCELRSLLPPDYIDKPIVGMVARLVAEKGIPTFLEAATVVLRCIPGARFILIGDGPLRAELESLRDRLGLRDVVHFLGFRSDARELIPQLDILAVSSISEGSPLVILEALLSRVPVVASAVGGIPTQIRDGRDGLIVPPRDIEALANALVRLLDEPDYAWKLALSGEYHIRHNFGHAWMVDRTQAVYESVLHDRRRSPMDFSWEGSLVEPPFPFEGEQP